ncbi:MAG TPA: hypothetical protein VIG99_09260 [Myxococcaceae bacterium]|jgi:hypothetical protein
MISALTLASALLLAQPEPPVQEPPFRVDGTTRIAAEVASGVVVGGLTAAAGWAIPCLWGDLRYSGCYYSFWVGYPIGLFLGTSVGVWATGSILGGNGSRSITMIGSAIGALASLALSTLNPYLCLLGPLIATPLAVIAYELSSNANIDLVLPERRSPLSFSVSVRADPRSPGLMLQGAF